MGRDGAYGRGFFIATGFHGLHVLVGTAFLFVSSCRITGGALGLDTTQGSSVQPDIDILSMWCDYFCTSGFMFEGQINIVLHNDQKTYILLWDQTSPRVFLRLY